VRKFHIVQGGIENGDKKFIERAATKKLSARRWVAPKSVQIGDDVVIYIGGFGFFATARITSEAKPRTGWRNRYGAGIDSIKLIEPPISLAAIQRHIPRLDWAKYPRSITSPGPELADHLRRLIRERRETRLPDIDDDALESANLDELRTVALLSARQFVTPKQRKIWYRARSTAIRLYVLKRANGRCEVCKSAAPFVNENGEPYLEAPHVERLADDGPDHPRRVIGVCPNCHRNAHFGRDRGSFKQLLLKRLAALEF
jgi:hypothetical protein